MAKTPQNSSNIRVDTRWFKNLPEENSDDLKRELLSAKKTLDKLAKVVYNIVINEKDIRYDDYETSSWSHKQAHVNGRIEAFNSILRLIEVDNTNV